jgi:hypothetical protein
VIEWTEDDHIFIGYSGVANPEPVDFNHRRFLRFRSISYPFGGRYCLGLILQNIGALGELEDSDREALVSLSGYSGIINVSFWRLLGKNRLGGVLQSDRQRIVVVDGSEETIVDNPYFEWASAYFTSSQSPYTVKHKIVKLSIFLIAMRIRT